MGNIASFTGCKYNIVSMKTVTVPQNTSGAFTSATAKTKQKIMGLLLGCASPVRA